jgi:ERCC4-related helicase
MMQSPDMVPFYLLVYNAVSNREAVAMRTVSVAGLVMVVLIAKAAAQSYDFNAQRSDVRQMQEELARQQGELDFTSSWEQRQRLQDQQFRLQQIERRNSEAETDWIVNGDKR